MILRTILFHVLPYAAIKCAGESYVANRKARLFKGENIFTLIAGCGHLN